NYWGIRQTGMGNAGVAMADDGNLFWYNPAGLARIKGFHNQLLNFQLSVDSMDTLSRIGDAVNIWDFNDLANHDGPFMQASLRSSTIGPFFGFGFYDNVVGYYDLQDIYSSNAQVDIYSFNDLGAVVGFGLPLGKWVSIGFSAKAL